MIFAALKRYIDGPTLEEKIAKDLRRTKDELYHIRMVKEDIQSREMGLKTREKRLEDEMIQIMEANKHETRS